MTRPAFVSANAVLNRWARNTFNRPGMAGVKRLLKGALRYLVARKSNASGELLVSLPAESFFAFLGISTPDIASAVRSHADCAAVIRRNLVIDTDVGRIQTKIADLVSQDGRLRKLRGIRKIASTLYCLATGRKKEIQSLELPVKGLLTALSIPEEDLEKVMLTPADVICGFLAKNVYLGRRLHHVYADVAHFMSYRGQPTLSEIYFRRSITISPEPQFYERFFHAMMMAPETTNEMIMEEVKRWAKRCIPEARKDRRFDLDRNPEKRLRVGYVCCFFYGLGTRIAHLPLMLGHDRKHFEIVAYSDEDVEDTYRTADIWRFTGNLKDEAFARLVVGDRIDILVEFNGRGGRNRFGAFAERIAPIQINFGNYLATTGMPAVDYTVAHVACVPPEEERFYTEKICRLDSMAIDCDQCWPEDFFPAVAPPPYRTEGRITFGCFGSSVKVHERLVKAWCDIVKRVEGSRFYYKAISMSDPGAMESFRRMFERHGITGDRLILEGASDHRTMLERYGRVDIALDTFPYNSGNTTLETLWQGVPVITLQGSRWAARIGLSLLTLGGLEALVAQSWDEYVEMAVRLAADEHFRDRFRATVRDRLKKSPLFDMPGFIRGVESAYRAMWREWLESPSSRNDMTN